MTPLKKVLASVLLPAAVLVSIVAVLGLVLIELVGSALMWIADRKGKR